MAQPRYTYDPVTQTYTRIDAGAPVQPVRGLGPLYDAGGGDSTVGTPGGPNLGTLSPMATEVGVGLQNAGQFANTATPGQMAMSPGMTIGSAVAGAIGNSIMGTEVSPVAAPTAPTETAIAPATAGLAAMNAQTAANQNAQAQQAAVANTAESVAQDVADVADTTDAEAGAAIGTTDVGTTDSGTTDSGGGGAGTGDAGGFSESDSTNAGDSDSSTYAQGGLASARKTEDMGRGNDTMLVHMTPNEVRGLQAIAMAHGGSLTINPKTGLVEAGFLDSILPVVAGAALTAAFPAAAPWMIGLGVGGGTALMTGSLEKGLMAGLGAFGGAGIGSALTAPAVTGTQAGLSQAAAQGLGVPGASSAAGSQAARLAAENAALGFTPAESMAQIANSANYAAGASIPANVLAPTAAQSAAINAQANLGGMQQGISNIVQGTPGAREGFMQAAGGPMGLASKAGAALAPTMFSAEEPDQGGKKPQEYIRPYSFDFKPESEVNPDFAYRTGKPGESTAEQRYFTPTFKGMGVFKAGTEPGGSFYGTPTQEQYDLYSRPKTDELALAAGGIAKGGLRDGAFVVPADVVSHLGNGSNDAGQKILSRGLGARPIKGKGDGMSDSIPTTIEGKQPARVADGEAYIPPEVVKKVGAKRLYAMMDKIRHARTGTKRQAPEVDPRKFLPA